MSSKTDKRTYWKKPTSSRSPRVDTLTPEEAECVRVAIKVLKVRFGSNQKLAKQLAGQSPGEWARMKLLGES